MKKTILTIAAFLLPLAVMSQNLQNNPFVKELIPKTKTETNIKVYKIKTKNRKCVHPQKLTPKETNKIFHCIKIKGKVSFLVLTNEEIIKIYKKFIEEMESAKPDEMVVVERIKNYIDTKNKKVLTKKIDKLLFWFKDNDTLVVFYHNKGYDRARILKEGFHVTYFKENGKTYRSAIEIKRDVWTKYINKAIFEKDYEATWENLSKNLKKENKTTLKDNSKTDKQKEEALTIEQLQKELQKLKDMLDKNLITEEEFKKLKKKLMERAGI